MRALLILFSAVSIFTFGNAFNPKDLRCAVCRVFIKEFEIAVNKVSDKKTVEVGGYKMGADGNVVKKKKLMVESEIYLSELLESTCSRLDDYVRGLTKDTGKLVLINLMDTTARPGLADVDIIQDGDLNRSLPHLCKGIIEEFEDDVLASFTTHNKRPIENICVERTSLCEKEDEDDDEEEVFENDEL